MSEFKSYAKVMGYVVGTVVILTVVGWVLKPVDVAVERMIIKNSFQYKEGMAQRGAILEANIIEVENRIRMEQDAEVAAGLENQLSSLRAQHRAVTLIK